MSRPQVPRLRLSVLLAPLVLAVAACGASPTTSAPSASEPTAMETPTGTPLAPVDSSSALPPAPTPLTSNQITNGELDVPAICTDGSQLAGGYYGQDLAASPATVTMSGGSAPVGSMGEVRVVKGPEALGTPDGAAAVGLTCFDGARNEDIVAVYTPDGSLQAAQPLGRFAFGMPVITGLTPTEKGVRVEWSHERTPQDATERNGSGTGQAVLSWLAPSLTVLSHSSSDPANTASATASLLLDALARQDQEAISALVTDAGAQSLDAPLGDAGALQHRSKSTPVREVMTQDAPTLKVESCITGPRTVPDTGEPLAAGQYGCTISTVSGNDGRSMYYYWVLFPADGSLDRLEEIRAQGYTC